MIDPTRPGFLRRLTWLYPQHECEARAQLAADKLAEWGYARPYKLFVSGPLKASTPNDPSGYVSWDWHVAAAVRVNGKVFVLDAAIEPSRPLPLEEWVLRLVPGLDKARGVICEPMAFDPATRCLGGKTHQTERALDLERKAFPEEWTLQIKLGRNPEKVLGDDPLWFE